MAPFKAGIFILILSLAGVQAVPAKDIIYPDVSLDAGDAPQNPINGLCYGKLNYGAVYETQIVKTLIKKAEVFTDPETGTSFEVRPAEYAETSKLVQVSPRRTGWFETPCPPTYTKAFVRTLQRALAARGYLENITTAVLDTATRNAIFALQNGNGLPSPILATSTARALGLISVKPQK